MRRSTDELRGQILDAARAEFARHGLAGSRIDRIANAASASKERLYAHFGDKETLFREVVSVDVTDFYRSVTLRPESVPEFVGDVYDLARNKPAHLRMMTWAQLEGFALDEPHADDQPILDHAVSAIRSAQAAGYVEPAWEPIDLLIMLFSIGLAWARSLQPQTPITEPDLIARQRGIAVEAARRLVSVPAQDR